MAAGTLAAAAAQVDNQQELPSSADALPEDLWSLILQHVPQSERLRCGLVCRKLAAAAAAATDALVVDAWRKRADGSYRWQWPQFDQGFLGYLTHHGRFLTSLKLSSLFSLPRVSTTLEEFAAIQALNLHAVKQEHLKTLPCPNLQELSLFNMEIDLVDRSGRLLALADCATALTSLKLEWVKSKYDSTCLMNPPPTLASLSALVSLRDVKLVYVDERRGCWGRPGLAMLPCGIVLPALSHLTRLHLSALRVKDLHAVSSLSSLLSLHLERLSSDAGSLTSSSDLGGGEGVAVIAGCTQLTHLALHSPFDEHAGPTVVPC